MLLLQGVYAFIFVVGVVKIHINSMKLDLLLLAFNSKRIIYNMCRLNSCNTSHQCLKYMRVLIITTHCFHSLYDIRKIMRVNELS